MDEMPRPRRSASKPEFGCALAIRKLWKDATTRCVIPIQVPFASRVVICVSIASDGLYVQVSAVYDYFDVKKLMRARGDPA
jgi:hypothetical protein